jgi:phospholipase/carboxylesterase
MTARFSPDLLPSSLRPGERDGATAGDVETSLNATRDSSAVTAHAPPVADRAGTQREIYVPHHYEANYPYPLLVWLLPDEAPSDELTRLMERVSERNALGIAVRPDDAEELEARLVRSVAAIRRTHHIHTERVYVAGAGELGTEALRISLRRPEWFAGAVALGSRLPRGTPWLARYDALRGKRIFLAADGASNAPADEARRMQRLLWSAGMSVRACRSESPSATGTDVLREINRWLVQGIDGSDTLS